MKFLFIAVVGSIAVLSFGEAGIAQTHRQAETQSMAALAQSQCGEQAYYDSLSTSESGGCGGPGGYNCRNSIGALGRYQFMPSTLRGMGIDPNNFLGNAALQERAIRQFTAANDACLRRNGAYNYIGQVRNGVTITKSGLLGAAHLGGCGGATRFAKTGYNPSDGRTRLSDYAAKFSGYDMFGAGTDGNCGGGVPNAAEQFAQNQAAGITGCDPSIYDDLKTRASALKKQAAETAAATIKQPPSVHQLTCFDQFAQTMGEQIGQIHSEPMEGIMRSVAPNAQMPNIQHIIQNFMTDVIGGSLQSLFNKAFGSIAGSLGIGGGGAGGGAVCDAMNEFWKLAQCMGMPELPSLADILSGGSFGGAAGGPAAGIMNSMMSQFGGPGGIGDGGGIMGAICQAAQGAMGGGKKSADANAFENMAQQHQQNIQAKEQDRQRQEQEQKRRQEEEKKREEEAEKCDYELVLRSLPERLRKLCDIDRNGVTEEWEVETVDRQYGNSNCNIEEDEARRAQSQFRPGNNSGLF